MKSWCGKGRNVEYVMRYRRCKVGITSVKIWETDMCMTADPEAEITDIEKCKKFNL